MFDKVCDWSVHRAITKYLTEGFSAAQIAEKVHGTLVEGGIYPLGIAVGNTTYYHPGLS